MTVSDLEPWASAIEMHILGDLEKIFDWGGRNGQEPPHCVFKHSIAPREVYLSLRPNYQSCLPGALPVRSGTGLF